jgi:hypothetical protein
MLFFIAIIIFLYFLGMFKNNKTYCSKYIPLIENYQKQYNKYPNNLNSFKKSLVDFRYSSKDCGYHNNKTSYSFYAHDGFMGVVGYSSIDKKWWYD